MSLLGSTLDPANLARREVIAFVRPGRGSDYSDVYALAQRYGTERLLELAASVDAGFDITVFVYVLDALGRFTDDEVPAYNGGVAAVSELVAGLSADLLGAGVVEPKLACGRTPGTT